MTRPALVLIHGRSQGGKDPGTLLQQWLASLREGLGQDADAILAGVDVRFPYYGDTLDEWVTRTASATPGDARGTGDPGQIDSDYLAFQQEVAAEILRRHGIDPAAHAGELGEAAMGGGERSPAWVQGLLRLLDKVPGVTGQFIAWVMRDVYLYLRNPGAQAAIDGIVTPKLQGHCVIVAHSLGTVVAYRLLKTADHGSTPLLLTLGSPLGIGPVRDAVRPRRAPGTVVRWVNAYDERDDVALYPLGGGRFSLAPSMPIEDIGGIDNRTDNHHGIVEYLNKPHVAQSIAAALRA